MVRLSTNSASLSLKRTLRPRSVLHSNTCWELISLARLTFCRRTISESFIWTISTSLIRASNIFLSRFKNNSGYDEPYNKLGELYLKNNDIDKALQYLEKGYKLYQKRPALLNNYGLALFNNNDLERAEVILTKWLEADNTNFKAYNNLGNVFRKLKRLNDALDMYSRSAKFSNNKHLPAMVNLASVYIEQNNIFACIECTENIVSSKLKEASNALEMCGLDQLVVHANIKQSIVWYENKEFKDGVELLTQIVDEYPNNIPMHWYLGLHHQKLGNNNVAIEHLLKAIQLIYQSPPSAVHINNYFMK